MHAQSSLHDLCAALAQKSPVPGGGAVAAALGALGAAVGAMAGRYSEGRKDLAAHAASIADEIARLDALRVRLLALVDEDAAVYAQVAQAYALPKGDEQAARSRAAAIETALRAAAVPPREMQRLAVEGLATLQSLSTHCNRNLASDVLVGAQALHAAAQAARVNVLINLASLKDAEHVRTLRAEDGRLVEAAARHAHAIESTILPLIGG